MPQPGLARSMASLMRWLLVLLLVFDQVGSPLHRHRHDSGIDGTAYLGQAPGAQHAVDQIDPGGHERGFLHASTTLRAEPRASVPGSPVDAGSQDRAPASPWPPEWQAAAGSSDAGGHWAEADLPVQRRHRSLPPEGRAPPGRA